jgi:TetR/AcrR family transcriptional regulator, transcriptional repressor for nem operon
MATARATLLDAGRQLMLRRGYSATSVDEVCAQAGVTKGSFFHHFSSKEEFGKALLDHHWTTMQDQLGSAPFNELKDPLARLDGYLDLFVHIAHDPDIEKSCLFGNLSQEVAPTNGALRTECAGGFARWSRQIAAELTEAKRKYAPRARFDPVSVAEYFIAIYEGSLILAKAKGDARVLADNVEHFRRYVHVLLKKGATHG